MKLALTINCWRDEDLIFARQFGLTHILVSPQVPEGMPWDARTLSAMRNRVEKAGFELAGLDGLPHTLGLGLRTKADPGQRRDEEEVIDAVCGFIRMAGEAAMPLIGYEWSFPGMSEYDRTPEGRGQAMVRRYGRTNRVDPALNELMWENLTHFLRAMVPVAEQAGVKLACHLRYPFLLATNNGSADAQVTAVGAMRRVVDAVPSPYNGIDFRQGLVAQQPGVDLVDVIRNAGVQHKLIMIEVENLQVKPPYVVEAFLDEPSQSSGQAGDAAHAGTVMLRALQAYRELGFDGVIRPAQPPGLVGDTEWGHKGQAFNVGYLRALLQVVERRQ